MKPMQTNSQQNLTKRISFFIQGPNGPAHNKFPKKPTKL